MSYGLSEDETIPIHLGGYGLFRTQVIVVLKGAPRSKDRGVIARSRCYLGCVMIPGQKTVHSYETEAESKLLKPDIQPLVPIARTVSLRIYRCSEE